MSRPVPAGTQIIAGVPRGYRHWVKPELEPAAHPHLDSVKSALPFLGWWEIIAAHASK
jgi:hypothetical protein